MSLTISSANLNMEIVYTFHAQQQIIGRKIEKVWIEDTIKYPDHIFREGQKDYAVKRINGGTLKAVFIKEKIIKVITVYWV